eukprot:gene19884-21825_t
MNKLDNAAFVTEEDHEEAPREKWGRKIEFVFSCVGFAVGYGNFWRFPFKCFKNGGGAFLIPFVICLLLAGIPLFFLELSVGQFTQGGAVTAWEKLCPLLTGLGYSMMLVSFFLSIYYNVILAWSCYYFVYSFFPDIPWTGCNHEWNSKDCHDPFSKSTGNNVSLSNSSLNSNSSIGQSPSREFFINNVLQLSSGIEEVGSVNWKLALALLFAWIMVYFCIWKGIRTTGKVVYVTATLPYVMLFVFFVNGLMLEGSTNGIMYYISPKWEKLAEPSVWIDAASQVFFSITIGLGVMLTFASYNPVHNNVYRDAMIIAFSDALTSIFSGFVVFSILGYMAHIQGKDITDPTIATDGPGLVFIVYPAALATMPQPHVWGVIFFLMLITLGLDSQFGQVELVCACIIEKYPKKLAKYKELVVLAVCSVMFLLGITCVTEGGMYVFHLLDSYTAGLSVLFVGIVEVFVVGWIYGAGRLKSNIEFMVDGSISHIWVILWKFITPFLCIAIFIFSLVQYKPLTYEKTYVYPVWADALGWLMVFGIILCAPVVAAKRLYNANGGFTDRFKETTTSSLEKKGFNPTEVEMPELQTLA